MSLDEIKLTKSSKETIFTSSDIEIDDISYDFNVTIATPIANSTHQNATNIDPDDEGFFDEFTLVDFEYLDPDDEDIDMSQVYVNDQDLLISTQLIVRSHRLAHLFRGIEDVNKKWFTFDVKFNFGVGESELDASIETMHDYLTQTNGILVTHLIGKEKECG